jgi:hypothetical protein
LSKRALGAPYVNQDKIAQLSATKSWLKS